jgi:hypothetical protein
MVKHADSVSPSDHRAGRPMAPVVLSRTDRPDATRLVRALDQLAPVDRRRVVVHR